MAWWLYVTSLLVSLLFIQPKVWRFVRYAITLVHEAGHALMGTLTGGRLVGVVVRMDSSGETRTKHYKGFTSALFSRIPTLLSGYPAPAFFGGLGIVLALQGSANAGWIVLGFLGLLCFIVARSLFTLVVSLPYLASSIILIPAFQLIDFPVEVSLVALVIFSALLIVGSVKDMWTLTGLVNLGEAEESDPGYLADLTVGGGSGIRLWNLLLWLATLLSMGLGGWLGVTVGEWAEGALQGIL